MQDIIETLNRWEPGVDDQTIEMLKDESLRARLALDGKQLPVREKAPPEPEREWTPWRKVSEWREELGQVTPNGKVIPMPETTWKRFRDRLEHERDGQRIRFELQAFTLEREKVRADG
jgi:hypothetical protein